MNSKIKSVLGIAILTLLGSQYAGAQTPTIVMTLQKLRSGGDTYCYYTWGVENISNNNFTDLMVDFTPYDNQDYALKNQYVQGIRLTPNGKARVEQITVGSACHEIKGIRIDGFNWLTQANDGRIDVKTWQKAFKFVFNGQAVNVKEVK